ncbi:MAG: hypothetical protein CM15mP58_11780 [Burkholderiaceae bacterium]|nr:MAG: hypothetical protein CM15mP58_11780 [Burkholderiaceae bacterium]
MHRFIPAIAAEVGAKIIEIPVKHHPRKTGKSKYGIDRTLRVILDLIWIQFSRRYMHRPIHALVVWTYNVKRRLANIFVVVL